MSTSAFTRAVAGSHGGAIYSTDSVSADATSFTATQAVKGTGGAISCGGGPPAVRGCLWV